MKKYVQVSLVSCLAMLSFISVAHAEWNFGIGTGLSFTNIDGTQGFNTASLGPVRYDVKLDPQDLSDVTESAFGFGGYATNGVLMIQYQLSRVELEDTTSTFVPAFNSTSTARINFKTSGGEVTVGYPVYKSSAIVMFAEGGVRYTKHEMDSSLTLTGDVSGQRTAKFDHDWADALVGVTINVPLSTQWVWSTRANAGFGGSDGTYFASTGLTWRFHKNWSTNLIAKYTSIKFENGDPGDGDWYLYDADEASIGLNVIFNW